MGKIWNVISRRRILFLTVGALLVLLGVASIALGGIVLSISAYFAGMILTGVLIVLSALLSVFLTLGLHTKPSPRVHSEAAGGLAKLKLKQSSYHRKHNELMDVLYGPDH
jgi:hypothetical protein